MNLAELKPGQHASILKVGGEGALRQHFLDMGVIPGATLKVEKLAPMGDPMELRIHGYELTLRIDDARLIEIEKIEKAETQDTSSDTPEDKIKKKERRIIIDHPGLGEGGRYHVKADENPLPDGTKLTFALAGNQNSGK
ncbi:MAG: ferrous iron transport protein A, partial [Clostridiales bacterium]|nr:ferrous iron transport protein A [Clostridiales bacterium]